MELDADLFNCYYCSGNYDEDLFSGASGFAMRGFQKLMEWPLGKVTDFRSLSRWVRAQVDTYNMFVITTTSTS